MKFSIILKEEKVDLPDSLEEIVKFAKKKAKGWRKLPNGRVVCKDGYCTLGVIARLVIPDVHPFPEYHEVYVRLGMNSGIAQKISYVNDYSVRQIRKNLQVYLPEKTILELISLRHQLLEILELPADKE